MKIKDLSGILKIEIFNTQLIAELAFITSAFPTRTQHAKLNYSTTSPISAAEEALKIFT